MSESWVSCAWCDKRFLRENGEIRRSERLGRDHFCCMSHAKLAHSKRKPEIEKVCPYCDSTFVTRTNKSEKTFCSPSCASAGSMTTERRAAQRKAGKSHVDNLDVAKSLRSRERWKYEEVRTALQIARRDFQFEYRIGDHIFDLALLDSRVLVEFDGPYHSSRSQRIIDQQKDEIARANGFRITRVQTDKKTIISFGVADIPG